MIIFYLRSSSIASWEWCRHKFYLEYVLGYRGPENLAAQRGNVLHKVFEFLAHQKLCLQEGRTSFEDDGLGTINKKDWSVPKFTKLAYDYYSNLTPELGWTDKDYKECVRLIEKGLAFRDGILNPLNQIIVSPEQRFDIEIKKPWAKYVYTDEEGRKEGYLGIKGTIDLVTKISEDVYEVCDYKSGKLHNWSKDKGKTYNDLLVDDQLLLYFYAVKNLYPTVRQFLVTIYYVKYQPFTLCYTDKDYDKAEQRIKELFQEIKSAKTTKLTEDWRCTKLCGYSKPYKDTNKSLCYHIRDELNKKGMEQVTKEYTVKGFNPSDYGCGGGRHSKKREE